MPELMKGKVWHERKHKVTYPVYIEPKYDEIRCHVIVRDSVEFLSYSGKPLANMQDFAEGFRDLSHLSGWREFDCGFLVNSNFNDSYRWVRSTRGLPDDLKGARTEFLLFDLPESEAQYVRRLGQRLDVYYVSNEVPDIYIDVPMHTLCHDEAAVDAVYKSYRERGLEGGMVKTSDHLYQRGKRIDGWLKMKPENDADGVIRSLDEAISEDGQPLGRIGSITIVCEDGSTARPHGIAHDLGRRMFENPEEFIGQWAEFKYMERDRQGGYRHPTFNRLREAKS